jgi:hypothetical protein
LEATNRKIAENEKYLVVRKNDLAGYQADLQAENDSYSHDTEVYNDLRSELQRELDTANFALNTIESGDFAGYVSERMNDD